ncbi:hypothetical protein ABBQ38_006393 [Trebouxia sp. C0009 RCD-2024]
MVEGPYEKAGPSFLSMEWTEMEIPAMQATVFDAISKLLLRLRYEECPTWSFSSRDGLQYEVCAIHSDEYGVVAKIFDANNGYGINELWQQPLDINNLKTLLALYGVIYHIQTCVGCTGHDGPETTCCRRIKLLEAEISHLKMQIASFLMANQSVDMN